MGDIFDDMGDTLGVVPEDANERPAPQPRQVPAGAGQRTKVLPTDTVDLARAKQEADAVLRMMGTSLEEEEKAQSLAKRQEIVQQVYKDAEKNTPFFEKMAKTIDKMDNNFVTRNIKNTVGETINVSAGIMLGAQNAFNSGVNAFKEGYNALGKLAKDHGMVDSFEPTPLIDFSKFQDENYPETTKVIAGISQAITPALAAAGAVAVSTPVAGVVAAGAASYMLLDPKGAGLAELTSLFKDTAIGKTLMIHEAFKYSEKKPDDTEIEGRLKNVLDYTMGETVLVPAVKGLYKLLTGAKKLLPFLKATDDVAKGAETAAPKVADAAQVEAKAVEGIPSVKESPSVLDAPPPPEFEQYTFEQWVEGLKKAEPPADVKLSPGEMLKAEPNLTAKRGAQSIPAMIEEGQKRQATAGWLENLLEQRKNNPTAPLSAEDSLGLDIEGLYAQMRAEELATKALATNDPLDVLAANEALDYQLKIMSVKDAVASEAGRTLGITEGLARAVESGSSDEATKLSLQILGSKGKAKLLQQYLDTYGGVRPIQERLKMIELIKQIPDERFAKEAVKNFSNIKKVVRQTGWRKFTDAAYSVWTSAVLTPKTAANVWLLNHSTTAMQAIDNYTASLIGKIPGIGGGSTLREANSFASAIKDSFWQGHKMGLKALVEGHPPAGFTVNGDFSVLAKDPDTAASNSVWGMLYQKGMSLATATGRLVMSADVISKYINETAFIKHYATEEAMEMAARMNISASERAAYITKYVEDVMKNPSQGMMVKAKDMAEKLTQSRSLENVPVLGSMQNALEEDPTGLLRFVFPFFRTGVNTTLNAIEYVPGMNLVLKNTREALLKGGKERDQVLAKMVNGSLFTFGVYELYDKGMLHGEMPHPRQQQALADGGKGVTPYTLDLTSMGLGAYYIRPLDPIGKILRMGALYSSVSHGNQDMEVSDYIHAIGAISFSQVTPESMQTINAVVDAIAGKDTKKLTDLLQTTLVNTLVPLRGTIKQMSNMAQGMYNEDSKFELRSPKGSEEEMMSMFKAQLADTVGYGLPPKRDIFGEPIKAHWLTAISPWPTVDVENSDIGKKLRVLSDFEGQISRQGFTPAFKVEMPAPEVKYVTDGMKFEPMPDGVRAKLTPDEYDDLIVEMNKKSPITGMTLKEAVNEQLNRHMKDLVSAGLKSYHSQEEKVDVYKKVINNLDKVFKEYEDEARKKIEASPDIQKRINDAVKKAKPLDMTGLSIFGGE